VDLQYEIRHPGRISNWSVKRESIGNGEIEVDAAI
jgi:hypothetical protein